MNQLSSNQHFSEADLLETYYMQPGASMPVMMHLADCSDCASRYERLEKKVRGLSACAHDDKPETFWARQRISVMRKIAARPSTFARVTRVAAAALLVAALGGWFSSRQVDPPPAAVPTAVSTMPAPEIAVQVTTPVDPWESEELGDFHSIVNWESWDTPKTKNGDAS
jgi:anti-sigma factor RsiW